MNLKTIFVILFSFSLGACQIANSHQTPTDTWIPSPTNIPRWQLYENALVRDIMHGPPGMCEWELLGQSARQVYVWARCRLLDYRQTEMSVPAVIDLSENGDIQKVTIPENGVDWEKSIIALFPADIQKRIFARGPFPIADMDHIEFRKQNGGPPLIVILGTPMP